jgi:DNA-binding FadR family transcriptional regulator
MKKSRSRGLHGRVVDELGRRIISGEFPAGAPLPGQEDCCAMLGVSRSVMREALRVLAAKGLVDARPKAGTFVRPREEWNFLDPEVLEWRLKTAEADQVIEQLHELRQMVEPLAASLAASKAKLGDFQKMGQAYEAMAAAGNSERYVEPDLKFHRAIVAASGNDLFASLGRVVEAALTMNFRICVDNPEGQTRSLEMHKAILDAIVDRDAAAARLAMQKLIDYSRATVLEIRTRGSGRARTKPSTAKIKTKRRRSG